MDHVIFTLIVLAIAAGWKAVSNATRNEEGGPASRPGSPKPYQKRAETEEERMRRFMEAVGLPPAGVPPPMVKPRVTDKPGPLPQVPAPNVAPGIPGRLRRVPPAQAGKTPVTRSQPPPRRGATRVPSSTPAPAPVQTVPQPAQVVQFVSPAELAEDMGTFPGTQTFKPPAPPPAAPVGTRYPTGALLARLRDPASIREAIILREVLGPPKALQGALTDFTVSGPR